MAGKASIGQGLMNLDPTKRCPIVTNKALFITYLFLEELVFGGMGIMTWNTLTFPYGGVHVGYLLHI